MKHRQMTNAFSWIEAFYPVSLNDFMTNSFPVGSILTLKPLNHSVVTFILILKGKLRPLASAVCLPKSPEPHSAPTFKLTLSPDYLDSHLNEILVKDPSLSSHFYG